MQTARYHREQAELCLEMARSMSDRQAADTLCQAAARHFAEALEVEKRQDHPPAPLVDVRNVTNKRPDDFSDSFYYRAIRTQIGEALRSQWVPTEPSPERLLDLLQELDQLKGEDAGGANGPTVAPAPPRRKER
jgi:hypothetical protein